MEPKINIGISESQREQIVHGLYRLLADTYTLYFKTHNYHWNVTDPCSRHCTLCLKLSTRKFGPQWT